MIFLLSWGLWAVMVINNVLNVYQLDSDAAYKECNICHDAEYKI